MLVHQRVPLLKHGVFPLRELFASAGPGGDGTCHCAVLAGRRGPTKKWGIFSGKHGGFRWEHYGNMLILLIYHGHYRQNGDYI